ncbi:MAG TPA: alpha/beta hydrolase [Oceanospirillales bacterium]|nr:alpha/beta hydrolase [Oceanospirillaceae bacterium]HBS41689.1 alpha/beta hydrolase [Oceanospirillales bacterium]|tara:strand:+ start:58217 stop:58798 length:582 start_codon:yes stop_codon:yes gene_type:complete
MAHGAGADASSEFMQDMGARIAALGVYVVRFDFPYMEKRREDGKRRPPDRLPKLLDAFREIITALDRPCVIGGKSMGGRVASVLGQAADRPGQVKGCACLGYPFHPPGKPESLRTEHLLSLNTPVLIAQGTRDAMGTQDEVAAMALDKALEFVWLADGNHDLKPRKASGFSHDEHLQTTAAAVAAFVQNAIRP